MKRKRRGRRLIDEEAEIYSEIAQCNFEARSTQGERKRNAEDMSDRATKTASKGWFGLAN